MKLGYQLFCNLCWDLLSLTPVVSPRTEACRDVEDAVPVQRSKEWVDLFERVRKVVASSSRSVLQSCRLMFSYSIPCHMAR